MLGNIVDAPEQVGVHENLLADAVVRHLLAVRDQCDVGAGLDVPVENLLIVDRTDAVAVGHDDIFFARTRDEVERAFEQLKPRGIEQLALVGVVGGDERGEQLDAAAAAGKVPVLTGADVIHQRLVVVIGDDADLGDVRVDHVGEFKVDHAVSAAERNRGDRAAAGQFGNHIVVDVGKDNTDSVHVLAEYDKADPYNLGGFKNEGTFNCCKYIAPKCYFDGKTDKNGAFSELEIHSKGLSIKLIEEEFKTENGWKTVEEVNKRFSYGEKFQPLSGMNIKGGKALIPIEKYLAKPVQGFFDSNIGLNEA